MSTDAELLRRYADENSEAAFAELVQRHVGLVFGAARRHVGGDAHLAQDVTQSVFTALARKAAALRGRPSLAGWLYLGAHHAAAQAVRSDRRRRTREQEAQAMHELDSSAVSPADWAQVRPVLDDALRALNETDREAVLLRFFERRPFGDIGAALNLSEDAARMRVDRALEKLRALLARHGITSTTAALATVLAHPAVAAAPAGLAATITSGALSGATAAAAAATGFMSTPILVSSVVALAAIGAAVFQFNETRTARGALAELSREHEALRGRVRAFEQRVATAEARATTAERDAANAKQQFAAAAPAARGTLSLGGANAQATVGSSQQGYVSLRPAPEMANMTPEQRRQRALDLNFESWDAASDALYRVLGLSAAQREQFRAIRRQHMAQQDERMRDVMNQARAQTPPLDRAALQAVMQAEASRGGADWLTAVRGAFGDATAQAVAHYYETVPARAVTKELSAELFSSDTPLTIPLAEQLVEIIARHSRDAAGKVDLGAMKLDAITAEAAAILTPKQLDALRRAHESVQRKWVRPVAPATGSPDAVRPPGN